MALCVYHETVESVATCVVCKQDICGKCREYGANGMCGMCLEMSNAQKATAEASRQARLETASNAPAGARPAAPGPRPAPAGATAARGTGPTRPPAPPPKPARPAAPPGMCGDHHDQKATALCAHCRKKVCPYCLDLYDLCTDCRVLDRCARHESMVAGEKCSACKLPFCRICLDNTDRCDRCRTLGKVGTGETKQAKTGPVKAAPKGTTGKLPPTDGAAGPAPAPRPKKPVQVRKAAAPYKGPRQKGGPLPLIAGGVGVLVLGAIFFAWGSSKPSVSDDEALKYLNEEMAYVQKAAIAIKEKRGAFPDSEEQILAEVKAQGLAVETLPVPIKLVINAPASEPLQISYRLVGSGFEIRALDTEGRPLAVDGRDVILRDGGGEEPHSTPSSGAPDEGM